MKILNKIVEDMGYGYTFKKPNQFKYIYKMNDEEVEKLEKRISKYSFRTKYWYLYDEENTQLHVYEPKEGKLYTNQTQHYIQARLKKPIEALNKEETTFIKSSKSLVGVDVFNLLSSIIDRKYGTSEKSFSELEKNEIMLSKLIQNNKNIIIDIINNNKGKRVELISELIYDSIK